MQRSISRKEFKKQVLENKVLCLVKFELEWSGSCQIIKPLYEDMEQSYRGIIQFFSVDMDKEKLLGKEYGVIELPTILFFRSGKICDHTVGLISKMTLISKIEKMLNIREQSEEGN
jgi:thioredoxin 1